MAVEQLVEDFGFDLGFFGGIILGFVAGIVVAVGPDGGEKEHLLAVGRPDAAIGSGGDGGELARRADEGSGFRVKELHVDLGDSVADGGEENVFAVGRKAQAVFGSLPGLGEAMRFAAGQRNDPEMRILGIVGERDIDGGEGDPARSGETVKSPMRLRFIMSSKVNGRFWAKAEKEASRIVAMSKRRSIQASPERERRSLHNGASGG